MFRSSYSRQKKVWKIDPELFNQRQNQNIEGKREKESPGERKLLSYVYALQIKNFIL
jgi:hypothetical protein